MAVQGVGGHGQGLLLVIALGDAAGQVREGDGEAAVFVGFEDGVVCMAFLVMPSTQGLDPLSVHHLEQAQDGPLAFSSPVPNAPPWTASHSGSWRKPSGWSSSFSGFP
jgi:hypothetical protein